MTPAISTTAGSGPSVSAGLPLAVAVGVVVRCAAAMTAAETCKNVASEGCSNESMEGMACYESEAEAAAAAIKMCCNGTCCSGAHDMSSGSPACWAPGVTHESCSSASILALSRTDQDRIVHPPCGAPGAASGAGDHAVHGGAGAATQAGNSLCSTLYGMWGSKAQAEGAAAMLGCTGVHMMGDQWMPGKSMGAGCGDCTGELAGHSMAMAFTASARTGEILFKSWTGDTESKYWTAIVVVFLLGLFYEWLKHWGRPTAAAMAARYAGDAASAFGDFEAGKPVPDAALELRRASAHHAVDALMYAAQLTLGYFLMLIAMVYNVGLFVSVVLGAALGYGLFAPVRRPGVAVDDDNGCCD